MANEKRLTWKRSLDGCEDVGLCEGVTIDEAICKLADLEERGAVLVVRCKDCIYAKNNYLVHGLCLCEKVIHNAVHGDRPRNTLMCEDDFCSYGELKDNDKQI